MTDLFTEKLRKKVLLVDDVLGDIAKDHLIHESLNAVEGINFVKTVNQFYKKLEEEKIENEA